MKIFINPKSKFNASSDDLMPIKQTLHNRHSERLSFQNVNTLKSSAQETHTDCHMVLMYLDDDEFAGFTQWLDHANPLQRTTSVDDNSEWLKKLKEFVCENLEDSNLSSVEICKHFGLSRSSLYRKLKKHTDKSATEFIREVRLEVALKYLKTKQCTIAEIAYKVGFSSPSHFTRVFKKNYKQTPSDALLAFCNPEPCSF